MNGQAVAALLWGLATATLAQDTQAAPWLEETFDSYELGPLDGQAPWTGSTRNITIVSTVSLTGRAVCCDADESPLLPVVWEVHRPVAVPDEGEHVFSFAVRVETPTASFASQATLALGNDSKWAIMLEISPLTAVMTISDDFTDCIWTAIWDLGDAPGGNPDLTTGTFHVFALDLDFTKTVLPHDCVRDVRLDGQSQAERFSCGFPAHLWLLKPMDRLILVNGCAMEGATPDAVFFDNVTGQPALLCVRHWHLYSWAVAQVVRLF